MVKLSADGKIMASVARRGSNAGLLRTYRYNNAGVWELFASLNSTSIGSDFSLNATLALSDDGTILALGTPHAPLHGKVRIFIFKAEDQNWVQLGQDLVAGDLALRRFGSALSMSGDGETLAVGTAFEVVSETEPLPAQKVFTYKFDGETWSALGPEISPATDYPCAFVGMALSLALSRTGDRMIVGEPCFNSLAGRVHVFEQSVESAQLELSSGESADGESASGEPAGGEVAWVRLGDAIIGRQQEGDRFGTSVAIAADGQTISTGAPGSENGCATAFRWDETSAEWSPFGSTLKGRYAGDRFGNSVELSQDGLTLAVGAPMTPVPLPFGGFLAAPGQVRVFRMDAVDEDGEGDWMQLHNDVNGITQGGSGDATQSANNVNAEFGLSVALSAAGDVVASGAPSTSLSYASVFQLMEPYKLVATGECTDSGYEWITSTSECQRGADFLGFSDDVRGDDSTETCQRNRVRNCGTWEQDVYLHFNARESGACNGYTVREECTDWARCICRINLSARVFDNFRLPLTRPVPGPIPILEEDYPSPIIV